MGFGVFLEFVNRHQLAHLVDYTLASFQHFPSKINVNAAIQNITQYVNENMDMFFIDPSLWEKQALIIEMDLSNRYAIISTLLTYINLNKRIKTLPAYVPIIVVGVNKDASSNQNEQQAIQFAQENHFPYFSTMVNGDGLDEVFCYLTQRILERVNPQLKGPVLNSYQPRGFFRSLFGLNDNSQENNNNNLMNSVSRRNLS